MAGVRFNGNPAFVTKEQVDSLELSKDDLFVCFDSALDDSTKLNIARDLKVRVI